MLAFENAKVFVNTEDTKFFRRVFSVFFVVSVVKSL